MLAELPAHGSSRQLVGQSQGAMEKGVKTDEGFKRGAEEGYIL